MASFTSFQNVLPDPNNSIGNAGQSTGTAGPGYASVSVTSEQPMLRDRTNSGRILARSVAGHTWKIKISYNPMTREDFEPVYTSSAAGSIKSVFCFLASVSCAS